MADGAVTRSGRSGLLSPRFVGSEEFAVAFLGAVVVAGFGVPLLFECVRHLTTGQLPLGCSLGVLGATASSIGAWKLTASLVRAHARYGS